jgi:hypothetical protein
MRTIPPPSCPRMIGNAPYDRQTMHMRKWHPGTKNYYQRTSGSEPLRVYSSVWHMPLEEKERQRGAWGKSRWVGSYLPV